MSSNDFRGTVRRKVWLTTIVSLLAIALLFMAATLSHLRSDWTEDQIYTLSDSTRTVLDQLEEPVMVRAYITSGLPQPYGRLQRFIEDMLHAYHESGNGNVGFEVIDPSEDQNVAASLAAMRIPKVQVQVVEDDQAQVKQGYLAVVIEYLDSKETIPVVQSEEGFEYLLTRKIKKLSGKGRAKIGVVSDFGATSLYQLHKLQEFAGDDYELTEVEVEKEGIADDVKALIIAGVSRPPSETFRYRMEQFRMHGGGLLLLAGNAKPQLSKGFQVQPVDPGANDWLKDDLGVAVEPGLVMDQRATRVTVNQQQGGFVFRSLVDYPFLPSVTGLNDHHRVTTGLERVSVPFASPLQPLHDDAAGINLLMRSSDYSAVQSGPPFDVNPLLASKDRFSGMTLRPSTLALAFEGAATPAFEAAPAGEQGDFTAQSDLSRMIVIGAPAFLDDEFMDGGNLVAVLNMVDWLSGDGALIDLRSRGVTQRPLTELSSGGRSVFKGLWMFGLPLLVAMIGMWRWWLLKRRRNVPVDS